MCVLDEKVKSIGVIPHQHRPCTIKITGELQAISSKACTGDSVLYCATTALDRYPSHLDKIHYIKMVTSLYICMALPSMNHGKSSLPSSSSFPFILYFQPIFASVKVEPPMN